MLFDDDPNWHSWVDNPMNIAREINFNHKNFTDVFFDCFGIIGSEKNKKKREEIIIRLDNSVLAYKSMLVWNMKGT